MPHASASGPYVLASHGTHSPLGRACVGALTEAVRLRRPDIEFVDAYVNVQSPAPEEVIRRLASRYGAGRGTSITIVPVLLSAGYHVRVDLRRAAEAVAGASSPIGVRGDTTSPIAQTPPVASDTERQHPTARVVAPLGPDPRLAAVLARRLAEAGWRPDDGRAVTITDAGSRDLAARHDINEMSALLARRLGRPVIVSHASTAAPLVTDLVRDHVECGQHVAVATHLLAPGHFASKLARSGADLVTLPLIPPAAADDPAAVPEELVDLVLDRAGLHGRSATKRHPLRVPA